MPDLADFELRRSSDARTPEPRPPRRNPWIWAALIVIVLAAAAGYYLLRNRTPATTPPSVTQAPPAAAPQPNAALGATPFDVTLPALDASDAIVRQLVRMVSSHPRVAAWLATNGLIRNFVVVVVNTADGKTPAPQLQRLRPAGRFEVADRNGALSIDAREYARYDTLAAAAAALDPAGSARLYATFKPLIEEAYRDLGYPDAKFDDTLERAIARVLSARPLADPVPILPGKGALYVFADPKVEALPAAQKQLLRMGPRNLQTIQAAVRAIALALGIPGQRLPLQ
jgi:hypothetical protein